MWRSKNVPSLAVTFVGWLNEDEFIGLYKGMEVICHVRFWEEIDENEGEIDQKTAKNRFTKVN